jgi:hypothetical protein
MVEDRWNEIDDEITDIESDPEGEPTEEQIEDMVNSPNISRNIFNIFGLIIVIGAIGAMFFFGPKLYANIKDGDVSFIPDNIKNPFSTINPDQFNTYDSIVKDNEENENLGVEIISFEPLSNSFFVGSPIQFRGVIKSSSLSEEDSFASLNCELENYYGEFIIDPKEVEIPGENKMKTTDVLCSFESGVDSNFAGDKLKATLNLNYEFYTLATYDTYIMKKSEYDLFVNRGENPFDEYGFKPENINTNNVMRSSTTKGPINLAISTITSQPFYDGQEILFIISLKEDWDGNLWQLKNLKLKIPEEIDPKQDTFCDFVYSEDMEGNYKIYKLKEDVMNTKVNNACSPEMLEIIGLSEERCIDEFKTEIQFLCRFVISDLPEDQELLHTSIVAETNYFYEIEKSTSINIINV